MSIVDGASLKDERLRALYQRSPGPVVFIDESLREPGRGERPFYSMSGVIIAKDQGDMIRQSMVEIAGSDYWHTTEAFASNLGKHMIAEMNEYLANAVDYSIITVQTEIRRADHNLRTAREECLTTLVREATRGSGEDAARLLVFERRNRRYYPDGDKQDLQALHRLRSAGVLNANVTGYHASPGDEPLLWAPDLVGWSLRRDFAVGDSQWFEPYEGVATVLHARTGLAVKGSNPHLPQPSPGVQPTTGPSRGGQSAVASESTLVHQGKESQKLAAVRAEADQQRPGLGHAVSLAVGTDSPRSLASIQERFGWYLTAQRAQTQGTRPSENIQRLLDQARQALDAGAGQRQTEPLAAERDVGGPRI